MLYTQTYLETLIADRVEENLHLDYKAAKALDKANLNKTKDSISKDVAAFANSDGGIIIYGLKEDVSNRHIVSEIDYLERIDISKEWLEQIIQTSIQPRIEGVIIHPIEIDGSKQKVVYVVDVPKSNTAHQSNDQRYYRRHNFNILPMYDYEIRDILNRTKHPLINLMFGIKSTLLGNERVYELTVMAHNEGEVYANYIMCAITIPKRCLLEVNGEVGNSAKTFNLDNTYRDVVDVDLRGMLEPMPIYGPARYVPILAKTVMNLRNEIKLNSNFLEEINLITWVVYADNASPSTGRISFTDIPQHSS
ncbi:ATP-binding protein [Mucilaginibacter sp. ZT4R22]|uniref:ATP-binding protein n=1 Tax=Mucilaginibacter pankratovii TaxID=2772110 RepID=A0ABR7WSD8_9SPHI|nr:ATP-binding protein [Mucilaginibacter pankratovii]MBD1364432.1 ATP-binding protein [Mucilaginibacter pankratovii]